MNDSKPFHTSAVYAMALNTVTLPFRMEVSGPNASSREFGVGSSDLSDMVRLVSCSQQKKLALLEASLPGPAVPGKSLYFVFLIFDHLHLHVLKFSSFDNNCLHSTHAL